MKIGINLASEPFRRDRPMLIGSAAVALLMAVSLGILIFLAYADRGAIRRDRQMQAQLNRELVKVQAEQRKIDAEVHRPENSEVLERSVLINELLLRKGISWTRIFADLEKTLPPNVRITQIRPQVNNNNQISLEMTIAADSQEPLTTFLTKIEGAEVFGSYNVSAAQAPTQTDPSYRYRMSVNYAQKF
jgi:type IV pilus assembly protein PilN